MAGTLGSLVVDITCRACRTAKSIDNFYRGGRDRLCKPCALAENKRWRANNPGKAREIKRKWAENNRDKMRVARAARADRVNEVNRQRYAANPEKFKARAAAYKALNREKYIAYGRSNYAKHAEARRQSRRDEYRLNREKFRERNARNRASSMLSAARGRAKLKGLSFDLDLEFVRGLLSNNSCEVSGLPFDLSPGKHANGPSLDRKDANLGYTKDNVRIVLYCINVMAHNWGVEPILEMADAIRARRAGRR